MTSMLPLLSLIVLVHAPAEIQLIEGVGIAGVTQGGRAPVGIDTVQAEIVNGTWKQPHVGDKLAGARGGDRTWEAIKVNKDGVFDGPPARGGYIDIGYDSDSEKPMILSAAGDTMVYINGVPRGGDPYSYGYLKIPFLMKKGHNDFLFACGRGSLKAGLAATDFGVEGIQFDGSDATLPDIVQGESGLLIGSVPVMNCSSKWVRDLRIGTHEPNDGIRPVSIPPWTVRKVPFAFRPSPNAQLGDFKLGVVVDIPGGATGIGHPFVALTIRVRKPTEQYKRTFVSKIDGSVQYYAVCPALKPSKDNALIMTVHGASVEAIGQAAAYQPKDWCTIVAPTNRRPYGFDWEDWGRMDAMEVWEIAKKEFPHDPKRVILTGHSMGGHGTWTLGLTYPNEFAAIGPSAGWISFWSYAGGWEPKEPNEVEQMVRRSMNSSDTLLMLDNAKMEDIYILHGDKDDNVPVEQAREMKQKLTDIGAKFDYHEQPGAGHWWGNQCVDWPPMFDLFDRARYEVPDHFEFTTVNPAVSSSCRGITIMQQIDPMLPSSVSANRDATGKWTFTTQNVASVQIDSNQLHIVPTFTIIGGETGETTITNNSGDEMAGLVMGHVHLGDKGFTLGDDPRKNAKDPHRSGPFKLAFQNRFVLVVGTRGTPEENEWAMNKARFDAEQWGYRGNGAVDIIRDDEIGRYRDRNLILYGNADTNSAFKLISSSPLQLTRGNVSIGGHGYKGDDRAVLFLYPEGRRMIGVVGGTGIKGMRLTERLPYFTSGVAYPDWTIISPDVLTQGSKAIEATGFFGNDWRFDPKNSAFVK